MITIITIILIVFYWLVKDLRHEAIGSKYLSKYFPESVVQAISLHVAAKRYLTAIDQEYQCGLSDASKKRLLQHVIDDSSVYELSNATSTCGC